MVRENTVYAVYDRFRQTGRFDALKCLYKEGDEISPHIYWDSDVAKWIEGVSYLLKEKDVPQLRCIVEEAIDNIIKNSDENGYFNSYFLVKNQGLRFKIRSYHELYCAGHLMEAAVAYYEATGEDRFLKAMEKYACYIESLKQKKVSAL